MIRRFRTDCPLLLLALFSPLALCKCSFVLRVFDLLLEVVHLILMGASCRGTHFLQLASCDIRLYVSDFEFLAADALFDLPLAHGADQNYMSADGFQTVNGWWMVINDSSDTRCGHVEITVTVSRPLIAAVMCVGLYLTCLKTLCTGEGVWAWAWA